MEQLRLNLTFPVELIGPTGHTHPNSLLRRGVIAVLALNHGNFVSSEILARALWGESLPASARAGLRKQLSGIRKDLEQISIRPERILHTKPAQRGGEGGGAKLQVDPEAVDLVRLRRSESTCWEQMRDDPVKATKCAGRAIEDMERGSFGTDLPATSWFDSKRAWIARLRLRFYGVRSVGGLLSGDVFGGLEDAQTVAADEGGSPALLIAAHFLAGDTISALDEVARYRESLAGLGLDLPRGIADMQIAILNGDKPSVQEVLMRYRTGIQ